MNDHLDLDALADVLAGVAAPEHLDGCTPCRSRLAELASALPRVSASLAALPAPAEPAGLAERVTTALATARDEQRPARGGDVVPLVARRTGSGLVWKVAAGLVAAAVLVTGAALVVGGGGSSGTKQQAKSMRTNSTGTDYGPGLSALRAEMPTLLAGPTRGAEAQRATGALASPTGPDPLARLRTTDGLAQCLLALAAPGGPVDVPLALDYARYNGEPALVVVLQALRGDKVDVFVVGADCSPADAKVLFFGRVSKP